MTEQTLHLLNRNSKNIPLELLDDQIIYIEEDIPIKDMEQIPDHCGMYIV